ncbi:MAG: FliH/SctL family protein [Actinomycetales bacterium]|jgi:flagellar assembly protein FliH
MTLSSDLGFTPMTLSPLRSPVADGEQTRGFVRGHSAGYAAGLRAAESDNAVRAAELAAEHARALAEIKAQLAVTVASLHAAVDGVHAAVLPVVAEAQDTLVATAMDLAEAVVGAALSDSGFGARAALARALSGPPATGTFTVRMSPLDLGQLDEQILARAGVNFVPDPDLDAGDAVADFESGYLDARISTALARARTALREDPQ